MAAAVVGNDSVVSQAPVEVATIASVGVLVWVFAPMTWSFSSAAVVLAGSFLPGSRGRGLAPVWKGSFEAAL
jgi:hypothetical protein